MRKKVIALLTALVLSIGVFAGAVPTAAAENTPEETIRQQYFAYVDSLGTPDAGAATSQLLNYAIVGKGKYQVMDDRDSFTLGLLHSNLYQTMLLNTLPAAVRYAQAQGLDTLYVGGGMEWYTIRRGYSSSVFAKEDCEDESRIAVLAGKSTQKGAVLPTNAYDQSMIDVVGGSRTRITLFRTEINRDTVTYRVKLKVLDDFDFNADYSISSNVEADLVSKFGMLLALGLIDTYSWESRMEFTITVPNTCIHETSDYRWYSAEGRLHSSTENGNRENGLKRIETESKGEIYYYHNLARTSRLDHDRPWVVEMRVQGNRNLILSRSKNVYDGAPYLLKGTSYMHVGYTEKHSEYDPKTGKEATQYTRHLYGVKYTPFGYKYKDWHTYRLENRLENGSNMVYLLIDGTEIAPLVDYYIGNKGEQGTQSDWVRGKDFVINYIGNSNFKMGPGLEVEYIQIWENGEGAQAYSYVTSSVTEPACTEPGKRVYTCTLCDASWWEPVSEPLGHREKAIPGREATCEREGLTAGSECTTCGKTVKEQTVIPALGHDWGTGKTVAEASCTAEGAVEFVCANDPAHRKTEIIPMAEHRAVTDAAVAVTCTGDGLTEGSHCEVCGAVLAAQEVIPAAGHSWNGGEVTVRPSPEASGERTYRCSACGEVRTEEIPYQAPVRIAGANRFETAFLVADAMKEALGLEKFEAVIVASGTNFADALSGSYLANRKNAPILLTYSTDAVNERVKEYIRANLAAGGTVYILGGEAAVPVAVEEGLDDFTVRRLAGNDRFGTNLAILSEAGVEGEDILACTGTEFADSLSASAAGLPILLVWKDLTETQKFFLDTAKTEKVYIIGGESAIGEAMLRQLSAFGKTERIGGENRFETSVNIAKQFFHASEAAVLAYAWNYPDGLCGGPLAAAMNAPLILTMTKYEAEAAAYASGQPLTGGVILGGETLISGSSAAEIFGPKEKN